MDTKVCFKVIKQLSLTELYMFVHTKLKTYCVRQPLIEKCGKKYLFQDEIVNFV